MAIYLKAASSVPKSTKRVWSQSLRHNLNPKTKRRVSLILFAIGSIALANAFLPIVNYEMNYSRKFGQLLSPLSSQHYNKKELIDISAKARDKVEWDYTSIDSWFVDNPNRAKSVYSNNNINYYTLSIPKLKVNSAIVEVGGQDLKKSLVQYPETSAPGQPGNTVIFGHSVLPTFFDPKNYVTIFSTLYQLTRNDEVFVQHDGVGYKYVVEDLFEVKPTDLSVLEQRYDDRFLTLITCSPPGTYLMRLIVRARLAR